MPVVLSPDGQPVQALNQDQVSDFLRQGYRLPTLSPDPVLATQAPASSGPAKPVQEAPAGAAVDLMKATLSQLVALEDVGTARAKKVRALAQSGTLNLDTLQAEIPEADWVGMYQTGKVTFPGGLTKVEAE